MVHVLSSDKCTTRSGCRSFVKGLRTTSQGHPLSFSRDGQPTTEAKILTSRDHWCAEEREVFKHRHFIQRQAQAQTPWRRHHASSVSAFPAWWLRMEGVLALTRCLTQRLARGTSDVFDA
mmetsp:Transcript_1840/g.2850  ORF Transcript_1840/g.2850 Transcript_1840/m.2850 type:complete len:120 (+) Transcript_1840:433-792(+)